MRELIIRLIRINLKVEIVEWHDGTFSVRLLWNGDKFYESDPSTGKLVSS